MINNSSKKWREAHPKENKERIKAWREKNPDKVREYQRRYTKRHPEKRREWMERYKIKSGGWGMKLAHLRYSAKKRGLQFVLDLEDIKGLYNGVCVYCGSETSTKTIDRKDNKLGYVKGNCLSACWLCNKLKGNSMSFNEMMIMGEAIRKNKQNNPSFWSYSPNWKR